MHLYSHIFSQLYSTINLKLPQVLLIKLAALTECTGDQTEVLLSPEKLSTLLTLK